MVPVSSVVRSRAMQGTRAGVASWRWSSSLSGASASWPMHQAGQAVVGDPCLSLSSVFGCHRSPLPCPLVCGGAVRGRVKRRTRWSGRADG